MRFGFGTAEAAKPLVPPLEMTITKHDITVLRQQKQRLDQLVSWFQRNAKLEGGQTVCANGSDALLILGRVIDKLEAQLKPAS